MDVHPPHQPIRGFRDFLLHLLTITIGLFIALTLEAAVESLHHRHLVRDSRENLDQEVFSNQHLYEENAHRLQQNRDRLQRDIAQLRDLKDGKIPDLTNLTWQWEWDSYTRTAWTTARDSGAVPFMDPEVISSYSYIYLQQDYINSTALQIFDEETKTGAALEIAGDAKNLSRPQIEALLLKSAELDLSLGTLQTTMKSLMSMYTHKLQNPR